MAESEPASEPSKYTFRVSSTVRAKFLCTDVNYHMPTARSVKLKPVYSQDPNHENRQFWDATPTGELSMTINNPHAASFFAPGEEYYIDFSRAPHDPGVQEAIDRYDNLRAEATKPKK